MCYLFFSCFFFLFCSILILLLKKYSQQLFYFLRILRGFKCNLSFIILLLFIFFLFSYFLLFLFLLLFSCFSFYFVIIMLCYVMNSMSFQSIITEKFIIWLYRLLLAFFFYSSSLHSIWFIFIFIIYLRDAAIVVSILEIHHSSIHIF